MYVNLDMSLIFYIVHEQKEYRFRCAIYTKSIMTRLSSRRRWLGVQTAELDPRTEAPWPTRKKDLPPGHGFGHQPLRKQQKWGLISRIPPVYDTNPQDSTDWHFCMGHMKNERIIEPNGTIWKHHH
jgi:hypothetical protein